MAGTEDVEPGNRIQVVVRVRPVLPHEAVAAITCSVTCSPDGSKVQVALPDKESSKPALAASSRPDAKAYSFDACLTGSTTQVQLFDTCGMDELVEAAVEGYNVTVFAFGQTGSGKTHTIIGPSMAGFQEAAWSAAASGRGTPAPPTPSAAAAYEDTGQSEEQQQQQGQQFQHSSSGNRDANGSGSAAGSSSGSSKAEVVQLGEEEGLLARCVAHLYASIDARRQEVSCRVLASCCEIYNEAVTDLLARNKNQQLQVRQDSSEGFYVEGLSQKEAQTPQRALTLMADALAYRHTRAHQLNSYSSRSHCLITLGIASQELQGSQGAKGGVRRVGKLVLVDLAGSERLKDTGNSAREAVRETGAINRSLFTLGQVLAALSVRGGCGVTGHVPYRDSRLTQLLWDGLKGDGRALMLACLSPLKAHADESLHTLHFASMALRIKSEPVIMVDPADQMVLDMRDMIRALQDDCRSLAGAIAQMSTGADLTAVLQALPPTLVQDALRYGASSAPTTQQGSPSCRSPPRSLRASGGRTRGGSGDRLKALGFLSKPGSADASLRHSLPSLPYSPASHSSSGPSSPSKANRGGSRPRQQQLLLQLQQQQQPVWNSSPSLNSANTGYKFGGSSFAGSAAGAGAVGNSGSERSSWPSFVTPPRARAANMQRSGLIAGPGAGGPGGLGGLGSSLQMFKSSTSGPGRPGQQAAHGSMMFLGSAAGSGQLFSNSMSPWLGNSEYAGLAGRGAAVGAAGASGGSYQRVAGASGPRCQEQQQQHSRKSVEDFPELAALEQQFQQQQQHLLPHCGTLAAAGAAGAAVPQAPMQFTGAGTAAMLVPSGLPASILSPRTLVPVRMSVTDTETIGTNPDASPVVVAIAAADSHVRPLAVPLPPAAAGAHNRRTIGSHGDDVGLAAGAAAAHSAAAEVATPEPKALTWAEQNPWFGADSEMTQLAYQVHDHLVGEQGMDPACDAYYAAIETQVAAAFPDKWSQWQAIMVAAAARAGARGSNFQHQQQQHASPTAYVSYRMPLKPGVPKFGSSSTASSLDLSSMRPNASGAQQQQHGMPMGVLAAAAAGAGSRFDSGAAAAGLAGSCRSQDVYHGHNAATLSQLLQHPKLATAAVFNPQQQQRQPAAAAGQLLQGRAFAEQMLQLYQQHNGIDAPAQQTQQQQQQQRMQPTEQQHSMGEAAPAAAAAADGAEAVGGSFSSSPNQGQQQQQVHRSTTPSQAGGAGLPELHSCASPVPGRATHSSGYSTCIPSIRSSADNVRTVPTAGIAAMAGSQAAGVHQAAAITAAAGSAAKAGMFNSGPQGMHNNRTFPDNSSGLQPGLARLGGVTVAASQVLASNAPSYYNGAGPLTAGAKQGWSTSKNGPNVQAGRDLAEVLRSGISPGNKSLVELQADYRAARALVLDQLRRQKDEAEQTRRRILMQIGRAINSSKWRA